MLIDFDDAKIQNIFFNVKSYMKYDTEMTFMNAVISQKELDFLYETTLDGLSNNLVIYVDFLKSLALPYPMFFTDSK